MKLPILITLIISLTGCVSALNVRNAENHAQAGYAAQRSGNWDAARRQFAQAVVNADLGDADLSGKSIVNYEYGRALGVTCVYDEAEKYLIRSKTMKEQLNLSPYLALYELGLMNEKQGNYEASANYFAQLIPEMKKEGLQKKYPLGVADAYDRYASALEKTGKANEAALQRKEAGAIRAANPNAQPFGALTPYGSQCAKTS